MRVVDPSSGSWNYGYSPLIVWPNSLVRLSGAGLSPCGCPTALQACSASASRRFSSWWAHAPLAWVHLGIVGILCFCLECCSPRRPCWSVIYFIQACHTTTHAAKPHLCIYTPLNFLDPNAPRMHCTQVSMCPSGLVRSRYSISAH